jgi:hypothetical protein
MDEIYPDRLVRELLAGKSIVNSIGESSQWVFLDDFGELERVPLDGYRDRIEPFDLRNDGYAEQLRAFFVFQGERRLFIPLKGSPVDLEGRIGAALEDIPFSFSALNTPRSPTLPAILFTVAAALTLLLSGEALLAAVFLPLWAVLAGLGVPGFALIAVQAGLSRLLREPLREYFLSRRYKKAPRHAFFSLPGVPPKTRILSILFLAALVSIAILGALPPLTVILGLLFFLTVLCLARRAESCQGADQGHIRFQPVPITGPARSPSGGLSFSRIMIPFTLAALVLLLLSPFFTGPSGPEWTGWKNPEKLSAERYREHVEFQQAFSLAPLGSASPSTSSPPYLRYSLAADGLIDGTKPGESLSENSEEIPPFPLSGLVDFLDNYSYTDRGFVPPRSGEPICLLIVFALCMPLIIRDRRVHKMGKKLSLYGTKRIAA